MIGLHDVVALTQEEFDKELQFISRKQINIIKICHKFTVGVFYWLL